MSETIIKLSDKIHPETNLAGFLIREMTEVYTKTEDGTRSRTVGVFRDPEVAQVFADLEKSNYHGIARVLVLTDGVVGFIIPDQPMVEIFNDESERSRLREETLSKLSPSQRKILGF